MYVIRREAPNPTHTTPTARIRKVPKVHSFVADVEDVADVSSICAWPPYRREWARDLHLGGREEKV